VRFVVSAVVTILLAAGIALAAPPSSSRDLPLKGVKIAVTVDDLPVHGDDIPGIERREIVRGVIRALKQNGAPATYGFANVETLAERPENLAILKDWLAAGNPLGNHTFHHLDLNKVSARAFIADIEKLDRMLATLASFSPLIERRRVFRYPFLSEGNTQKKRDQVRDYLKKNGYRIAQVSIDYDDWVWTDAYARCVIQHNDKSVAWLKANVVPAAERRAIGAAALARELFGRDIAHILLVHVGAFDALTLDSILADFRAKGATLISLDEALADPVYQPDPRFISEEGRPFPDEFAIQRGLALSRFTDRATMMPLLNAMCASNPSPGTGEGMGKGER